LPPESFIIAKFAQSPQSPRDRGRRHRLVAGKRDGQVGDGQVGGASCSIRSGNVFSN
jgi:hypothetical protein